MSDDPMAMQPSRARELERALALFLETQGDPAQRDSLLSSHPELREWLAPLLHDQTAVEEDPSPRILGDYRLLEELGRGGMGVVYAAWQLSLGRRVAVKLLAPGLLSSASALTRFRREAAAAGRLRHPSIVEIYDFGSADGEHFFSMELVDGEPLHRCAERFARSASAVQLVEQVVDALRHAHEAGLVHRDVKPANILVRGDGSAALTDFGLAMDEALPSLTHDGGFVGTLDYASPEQLNGERVDARTDIFSIGVVLAELLAGRHPFAGPTQASTTSRILGREPKLVDRRGVPLPRDLAAILDRALAKDRNQRYSNADTLHADLQAWRRGDPVSVRPPGPITHWVRRARREPWRAAALLSLVLGAPTLAGVGGFLLAKAPAIAAGEESIARRLRDEQLGEHWLSYVNGEFSRVLAAIPSSPDLDVEFAILRAFSLAQIDRRTEAIAMLSALDVPAARLGLAMLQSRQSSRATNADSADLAGTDALAWYVLAADDYSEAAAEESVPRFKSAMQHASTALALSDRPQVWILALLGRAAARAGEVDEARRAQRALRRHFADLRPTKLALADIDAIFGHPSARAQYEALVALEPTLARLHFALGVLEERERNWDRALARYRRAVELEPDAAPFWNNLGRALRRANDLAGAIQAYRHAIDASPTHFRAWNNLGNALRANQDHDGAAAAYRRAIELRPNYGRGHYNLGVLQLASGDLPAAIESYRRCIELEPGYAPAHCNLSIALWRSGQRQDAMAVAQHTLTLAPEDPRFLENVIEFGIILGDIEPARRAAKVLTSLQPDSAKAQAMLAVAWLVDPSPDVSLAGTAVERMKALRSRASLVALVDAHLAEARRDSTEARRLLDVVEAEQDREDWEIEAGRALRDRLPR